MPRHPSRKHTIQPSQMQPPLTRANAWKSNGNSFKSRGSFAKDFCKVLSTTYEMLWTSNTMHNSSTTSRHTATSPLSKSLNISTTAGVPSMYKQRRSYTRHIIPSGTVMSTSPHFASASTTTNEHLLDRTSLSPTTTNYNSTSKKSTTATNSTSRKC